MEKQVWTEEEVEPHAIDTEVSDNTIISSGTEMSFQRTSHSKRDGSVHP